MNYNQTDAEGAAHQRPPGYKTYGRSASVEWASSIRPKKQIWLWDQRIPVGTASAFAGRGGTGKTTYAFHLIAQLSRGLLPGTYYGHARRTLVWSGEDQWDTVIVPRLIAAKADLENVGRLVISSDTDGETREVTPRVPLDTLAIGDAVATTDAALVLIDPIASTMSGDLNREADVRSAVDALADVAAETTAVMILYVNLTQDHCDGLIRDHLGEEVVAQASS